MRHDHSDAIPVLAILLGTAAGVLGTGLLSGGERAPVPPPPPPTVELPSEPTATPTGLTPLAAISVVEWLSQVQSEIRAEVQDLPMEPTRERMQIIEELRQRKDMMGTAVRGLERDLDAAAGARTRDTFLSRTYQDAAGHLRETRLKEAIYYSRGTIEQWDRQSATTLEQNIEGYLVELRSRLVGLTPTFTPFTAAPIILNEDETVGAMLGAYPPLLREAGIGGTVLVYFFIGEDGTVEETLIDQSSGHRALDEAALVVADAYRFSPALNRDAPVPAWVSLPVTFRVR